MNQKGQAMRLRTLLLSAVLLSGCEVHHFNHDVSKSKPPTPAAKTEEAGKEEIVFDNVPEWTKALFEASMRRQEKAEQRIGELEKEVERLRGWQTDILRQLAQKGNKP